MEDGGSGRQEGCAYREEGNVEERSLGGLIENGGI